MSILHQQGLPIPAAPDLPPGESDTQYLLLKGRSGMGNRILAFCAAVLYARLSGRQLVVDWSDRVYSADRTNVFSHYFHSPHVDPAVRLPDAASVTPPIWEDRLDLSPYEIGEHATKQSSWDNQDVGSIKLTRLDYLEQIAVMWSYTDQIWRLRRQFPSEFERLGLGTRDEILRQILSEELLLQPAIRARVDDFKARHFTAPTVGVHVRFSDRRVAFGRLLHSLDALLEREPTLQIFLATDNSRVVEIMEGAYSNVVTRPHWYPQPGMQVHDGKVVPDRLGAGADALVDLYLLAECDYLIIDTLSSFSDIARLLSKAPPSNIFNVFRKRETRTMRNLHWRVFLRSGVFHWGLSLYGAWVKFRRHARGRLRGARG